MTDTQAELREVHNDCDGGSCWACARAAAAEVPKSHHTHLALLMMNFVEAVRDGRDDHAAKNLETVCAALLPPAPAVVEVLARIISPLDKAKYYRELRDTGFVTIVLSEEEYDDAVKALAALGEGGA